MVPVAPRAVPPCRLWHANAAKVAASASILLALASSGLAQSSEGVPLSMFRDMRVACDLNLDGATDLVSNDWGVSFASAGLAAHPVPTSHVRAISGSDGSTLWSVANDAYFSLLASGLNPFFPQTQAPQPVYHAPDPPGSPLHPARAEPSYPGWAYPVPERMTLQIVPDASGDGICDVLVLGFHLEEWIEGVTYPHTSPFAFVEGRLALLEGNASLGGKVLWEVPVAAEFAEVVCCGGTIVTDTMDVTGFPTGVQVFLTNDGPRIAWKTTDITYRYESGTSETWLVTENVSLLDAKTGIPLWTRSIQHAELVSTWIVGPAGIGGSDHLDLVLREELGRNLAPQDARVRALDGDPNGTGQDLWGNGLDDSGARSFVAPRPDIAISEATPEALVLSSAQTLSDLDGDGAQEVVGLYLTLAPGNRAVMGDDVYHTHVSIIGSRGTFLWDGIDNQAPGWGRVVDVPGTVLLLTADVPTNQPPGTRYPARQTHAIAYSADGQPLAWNYDRTFAADSNLAYQLALAQAGAPPIRPGEDGGLRLIGPARAIDSEGNAQMLLNTRHHAFDLLDPATADIRPAGVAIGPLGIVLDCGGEGNGTMTTLSGHAGTLTLSRMELESSQTTFATPIYANPTPQAQVAGRSIAFIGPVACEIDSDGSTLFAFALGVDSVKRHEETLSIRGRVTTDGELVWIAPAVEASEYRALTGHDDSTLLPRFLAFLVPGGAGIAFALLWDPWRRRR